MFLPLKSGRGRGAQQIPPLRFAPVGMTKRRGLLNGKTVAKGQGSGCGAGESAAVFPTVFLAVFFVDYIFIFLKRRFGIARTSSMIKDQNQGR